MIDRKKFFDGVRNRLFNGTLTQPQVDGLNGILGEWDNRYLNGDLRWLAYILATAKHETNETMQPVREAYWLSENWRKANLRYYPYYGRGFCQLTWKSNYEKFGARLGLDLVDNPDLALELDAATRILFDGMVDGLYTGVGLPRYFNSETDDWLNARRIVNGTDCAADIAVLGRTFNEILRGATT